MDQAIYKHPELGWWRSLDTLLHCSQPNCTQVVAPHAAFVHISAAFVWIAILTASMTKWEETGGNLIYSHNLYIVLCIIHSSEIVQHREEATLKEKITKETFRGSKQKCQIQV